MYVVFNVSFSEHLVKYHRCVSKTSYVVFSNFQEEQKTVFLVMTMEFDRYLWLLYIHVKCMYYLLPLCVEYLKCTTWYWICIRHTSFVKTNLYPIWHTIFWNSKMSYLVLLSDQRLFISGVFTATSTIFNDNDCNENW